MQKTSQKPVSYSIVVPVYNAQQTIEACLASLISQHSLGSEDMYDIIVVDDGSTDQTVASVHLFLAQHRFPLLTLLRGPHLGAAAARNRGTAAARGDIVLFTDADCAPEPTWLARMTADLRADPTLTATRGVYITHQRSLVARFVQQEYNERYQRAARADLRGHMDFIDTYSAAYRRAILLSCGGFDTSFTGATVEDQELSFRLFALGHRFRLISTARVAHHHPTTVLAYARRKYRIGRDKPRVHRQHPRQAWRDAHTPQTVKWQTLLVYPIIFCLGSVAAPLPCAWRRRIYTVLTLSGASWLISSIPLLISIARRDRAVLVVAPLMLVTRALALAAGLMMGMGSPQGDSSSPTH